MANEFLIKLLMDHGDALNETDQLINKIEKLDDIQKKFGSSGTGINNMTDDMKKAEQGSKDLASQFDKQIKEFDKAEKSSKKVGDSYQKIGKEANAAGSKIDDVADKLDKSNKETDKAGKSLNSYGDKMRSVFSKIFPLYGQIDDSLGDIISRNNELASSAGGQKKVFATITQGIASATKAGLAFVATPIGAAIAAMAAIGTIASKFISFNTAVIETNKTLQGITNESGEALDAIRIRAEGLLNVFDVSIEETTKTAQKLVATFDITYDEAFSQLEEGLIRGAKANDQFFDSLSEYGVFFSEAGFQVDEFRKIVEAGYDLGVYNDKLPDAIKEFNLSIQEQTKASRDALVAAFGDKFTNQLFANVNSGAISTKEALELISAEANNVGLNAKQAATITADVFRGAGEDVGGALKVFEAVNLALDGQEKEYTDLELAQKEQLRLQNEFLEAQKDAFQSDGFLEFQTTISNGWKQIQIFGLQVFTSIRESIQDTFTRFGIIGDSIRSLFTPFETFIGYITEFEFVQNLLNKTSGASEGIFANVKNVVISMLNPFTFVANAVKTLGAAFNGALSAAREFQTILIDAIRPFKDFDFSKPIESIRNFNFDSFKDTGKKVGGAFIDGYKEVMDVDLTEEANNPLEPAKDAINALGETADKNKGKVEGILDPLKDFKGIITDLKKQLENQIFTGDFIGAEKTQKQLEELEKKYAEFLKSREEFLKGVRNLVPTGELETLNNVNKFEVDTSSIDELQRKLNEVKATAQETGYVEFEVNFKEELFDKAKAEIASLFKVDQKIIDDLFEGLNEVSAYAVQIAYELYDARLSTLDAEIDAIQSRKAAIEDGLDEELELQNQGFANSYDLRKQALDDINAEEEAALKKRNALKTKAARAEFIAETASQTLNLISAVAKIYNSLAAIPVFGVAGATAVAASMYAAFGVMKARAFSQIGANLAEGGSMSDYFEHEQRAGNIRTHGRIDPKGGGKSDKNGQRGMRVGDSNLYVNGNETVMRNELNHSQGHFLEELNRNWQKYEHIDFQALLRNQIDPSSYNVTFQEVRAIEVAKSIDSVSYEQMVEIMKEHAIEVKPLKDPAPYKDSNDNVVVQKGSNKTIFI